MRGLREGENRSQFIQSLESHIAAFIESHAEQLLNERTPDADFTELDRCVIEAARPFFEKGPRTLLANM